MKRAGRVGDNSYVRADSHGCATCPHAAHGPAASGSSNVLINDRPALRVGDSGVHASCCGTNRWEALDGAPRVLINGCEAHRTSDADSHCGGTGALVTGSRNVAIGDHDCQRLSHRVTLKVVYPNGAPARWQRVRMETAEGSIRWCTTDREGMCVAYFETPEKVKVSIVGQPGRYLGVEASE